MEQEEYFMNSNLYSIEEKINCIELVKHEMLAIFNNWKD